MKQRYTIYALFLLSLFVSISASAQIKGVITDSLTNEPLMYITVQYEGKGVGGISNANGEYQVETRKGWDELTFSAVGYITKKVKLKPGTRVLNVKLQSDDIMLSEVVVKPKKEKYSRKNNPAVEFMKKVIENKKALKLEENDYYQYQKYEKMKMSLNDVTPDKMEKGIYKKFSFFKDQVEVSPKTNKMILPISIKETASKTIFRKNPKSEKTIIEGMNSTGIEEFFNTGDMLGTILTDVFSDINIYDDDIRLLQRRFVSPIGRGAISFYKYYLMDTLMVDRQECVHLTFVPQNPQDFGFTGHLYVVKDSTYAVKKCTMNLPKKTGVNFVENLDIVQQFEQLPDGNWVLTDDDMTVELHFVKGIQGLEVQRTTKYSDYQFTEIEPRLFRLKGNVIKEANMLAKSDEYWAKVRQVPLTKKESTMDVFMNRIEQIPGFKYVIFGAKALIENFVETGSKNHPSKFDFGPINTMITSNYVNGTRFRLSGMTTGNLDPHWSLSGYGAYGTKDKKWFYSGQVAYSFNKREYVLWEFPKHYIAFKYTYDVMSPMDKYLATDKGGVLLGRAGQLKGLLNRNFPAADRQLTIVGVLAAKLKLQGALHAGLTGGGGAPARNKAAGDIQHSLPCAGQRGGGLGGQSSFLGHGTLQALHNAGVLLDAAVSQRGEQLELSAHGYRGTENVRAAQINAVLADGTAVAVFRFTPDLRRALGILPGGQLNRFFKGKFLLGALQPCAGLLALVVDRAAQIALALPAPARNAVLQHNRRYQAFDNFEHCRQIVGYQYLGLHRQFQPRFPAAAIRCDGVLEHLEFHIACPFPVMFWGIICGRAKK